MQVTKQEFTAITKALNYWKENKLLEESQAEQLKQDLVVYAFNWRKLSIYGFWIAIICFLIAVAAILGDTSFINFLASLFYSSTLVKITILGLLATTCYKIGFYRKQKFAHKVFSNEAIMFLGVCFTYFAIEQMQELLPMSIYSNILLLSFACMLYFALGWLLQSKLIWLFALLILGGLFGMTTGYMSGWGAYYFGMNYPLRFVLFGMMLVVLALMTEKQPIIGKFFGVNLSVGLLYLFMSLWILSIFGDYSNNITAWMEVKQIELFHWSLLFAFASIAAIYHGLKYHNNITRGFGLVFLLINLYTRFFEFFWNSMHKAIFFLILGITFWLIATKAEKIWSLGEKD